MSLFGVVLHVMRYVVFIFGHSSVDVVPFYYLSEK